MADILHQLQSRIDRRSNFIAHSETFPEIFKDALKRLRDDQALDKRLFGEIVRARQASKVYSKLVRKYADLVAENVRLHGFDTVKVGDIISERV